MDRKNRDVPVAFSKNTETSLEKKSEEAKCNYLILWIGKGGHQIDIYRG